MSGVEESLYDRPIATWLPNSASRPAPCAGVRRLIRERVHSCTIFRTIIPSGRRRPQAIVATGDTLMDTWDEVVSAITRATGRRFRVQLQRRVTGGDMNRSFRLQDGATQYFVKVNDARSVEMFAAESEGLRELSRSGAIRTPTPICAGVSGQQSYLVLEYLRIGSASEPRMAALGEAVARLHRCTRRQFGWHLDNTIGITPQWNPPTDDWVEFWRQARMLFQVSLARKNGLATGILDKASRVTDAVGLFFRGYKPQASLLHGDLWAGNKGFLATGEPVLFDPAVYFGDREADIAMTELFGAFPRSFYDAYNASWPLDAGYPVRRDLYQLYHLLNHFNLFGVRYAPQTEATLDRLLANLG